jgi:hypothetical protein
VMLDSAALVAVQRARALRARDAVVSWIGRAVSSE